MERDAVVRALCEWLASLGIVAEGIQFRYGGDLVQVIRNGRILATFSPSSIQG